MRSFIVGLKYFDKNFKRQLWNLSQIYFLHRISFCRFKSSQVFLNWPQMIDIHFKIIIVHNVTHEICTWICWGLFSIVYTESSWNIHINVYNSYSSGLVHWNWNHIIIHEHHDLNALVNYSLRVLILVNHMLLVTCQTESMTWLVLRIWPFIWPWK